MSRARQRSMYWFVVEASNRDGGVVCCCSCVSRFMATMNPNIDSGCCRKMRHHIPTAPAVEGRAERHLCHVRDRQRIVSV